MHAILCGTLLFAQEALPVDLSTRQAGVDWPAFLGPLGTSISPERGIVVPWTKDSPRLVWQIPVGTGYGMPSISRGRLFFYDRIGTKARLSCLESETGKPIWKFEHDTNYEDYFGYNNGPRCCPVIDGDRVYIHSAEGLIHCVRVADGRLTWKSDTRAEFGMVQNFFGVGSTPIVEGDLLIAQVGGSPPGSGDFPTVDQKGNGSGVVAFEKRTGKVKWKASNELASYAGPVMATIHGLRWCLMFARGGLLGLDPADGKVRFHFPWRARSMESVNGANPVVVGDRVLISETYGPGSALVRVKPDACELIWSDADKARKKSLQCHWSTPIHHEGFVYGSSGRHLENAELRCVELATGKVMWSEPDLTRVSLLMVDGHFVCLGEDGAVRLLRANPNKYEEISVLKLPLRPDGRPLLLSPCWAAPIVSHGLMYLRGSDRLICLELIPEKKP